MGWSELVEPFHVSNVVDTHVVIIVRFLFVFFATFMVFALANVLTGYFCDAAMQVGAQDKRAALTNTLRHIFQAADSNMSGDITWEEFQEQLDNKQVQTCFKEVDIGVDDAFEIFHLIDADRTGSVSE